MITERLTIGEVARRSDVMPSAIRYYERQGLLPKPERVSGRRCYESSILQRLGVIQVAKQAGFTLAEIKMILYGFTPDTPASTRWRALAEKKLPEVEMLIRRAQAMRTILKTGINCACLTVEDCFQALQSDMCATSIP